MIFSRSPLRASASGRSSAPRSKRNPAVPSISATAVHWSWRWRATRSNACASVAIFIGAAVATRRNDHLYLTAISEALHGTPRLVVEIALRLVVLGVAACLIWFGYLNYLRGFGSFRLPSGTPIASLYAVIPISGALIALFSIEQLVNGLINGFDHPEPPDDGALISPIEAGIQRRSSS